MTCDRSDRPSRLTGTDWYAAGGNVEPVLLTCFEWVRWERHGHFREDGSFQCWEGLHKLFLRQQGAKGTGKQPGAASLDCLSS